MSRMQEETVLELFEGLTVPQAREFSRRIIPTLRAIRDEIKADSLGGDIKHEQLCSQKDYLPSREHPPLTIS